MKRRLVTSVVAVALAVIAIGVVAQGFTASEKATITALKQRLSALEAKMVTVQANDAAMHEGLMDLIAPDGPIAQVDHNLVALSGRVDDFHPPIAITGITPVVDCTATQCIVTVEWNVDPPATGQVEWGTTTAYGNLTTKEDDLLAFHSQRVGTFPNDGKTYHFRVIAEVPDVGAVSSLGAVGLR